MDGGCLTYDFMNLAKAWIQNKYFTNIYRNIAVPFLFIISAGHIETLLNVLMMAEHLWEMTDDNIYEGLVRGDL